MMKNRLLLLITFVLITTKVISQPFADIVNFNVQTFSGTYKDSTKWKNHTDNYFLNFFLPKEFKNGNTLLIRLNSEMINSTFGPDSSYTSSLISVSMPLGFQFVSKNKKWKTVTIVIPKLAGDMKDRNLMTYSQLGGIFLENYIVSDKLKFKLGLYYNREAFGNFFMPLVGMDWKVNKRLYLYGTLPSNYRVEINIIKNKLYAGLGFKSLTRSFQLSKPYPYNQAIPDWNNYVRYDEEQIKLFLDCFIYKKFLLYGEVAYSIGKNPILYNNIDNLLGQNYSSPVYNKMTPYPIFNIGISYRIRLDLEKAEENKQ